MYEIFSPRATFPRWVRTAAPFIWCNRPAPCAAAWRLPSRPRASDFGLPTFLSWLFPPLPFGPTLVGYTRFESPGLDLRAYSGVVSTSFVRQRRWRQGIIGGNFRKTASTIVALTRPAVACRFKEPFI